MPWQGVAFDFDGTLVADQGQLSDPETTAALRQLRDAGYKLILNTGRTLSYLYGPEGIQKLEDLLLFDAIVAEGGATLWFPRQGTPPQPLAIQNGPLLIAAMRRAGVPATQIWPGAGSIGTMRRYHRAISKEFRALNSSLRRYKLPAINVHAVFNGSSVVYLPPGVDKGAGLLQAMRALKLEPGEVIGVGDGENDFDFLKVCGLAVALGNARPGLLRDMKKAGIGIQVSGHAAAGARQIIAALLHGENTAEGLAA